MTQKKETLYIQQKQLRLSYAQENKYYFIQLPDQLKFHVLSVTPQKSY